MFFLLLCLIIFALIGTGRMPDSHGWMMLTGLGWFMGYLDCRQFAKSDQDKTRVLPPDSKDVVSDQTLFKS